jgi:hypothetical protein
MDLLHACRGHQVRFAVSVPRSAAMWRIRESIPVSAWRPAREMPGAEVAETTYAPGGWKHEPLRLLVRRVRIRAEEISLSPRSRRRRTIPKVQLALGLSGALQEVFGYSFILTDLKGDAVEIEQWQRRRAHIEECIKETKLDGGLDHLPLRTREANTAWQVATVMATNLMSLLSATIITGRDEHGVVPPDEVDTVTGVQHHPRYRRGRTLRRWMLTIPGRLVRGGRRLGLRLPQGAWWAEVIIHAYQRLRLLPVSG